MNRGAKRNQASEHEEEPTADSSEERLTRKRVADQLGVSIFKVRSMEGRQLRPVLENGVHYFAPDEVAALARALSASGRRSGGTRSEGQIAALAFRAFEDGKDLHAIVMDLAITPEKVRALYREWREPDLEHHELRRRNRERAERERREEEAQRRREEKDMALWERQLARLTK
jgi:hypothetical protein